MNEQQIHCLVAEVVGRLLPASASRNVVPLVEVSGRHVHLSQEDVELLFGPGYRLQEQRALSQPGQFLAEERISIIGTQGEFHNVAILGPARKKTQVEISLTDAHVLGLKPPVRQSGDTAGCPGVFLLAGDKMVRANEAVLAAQSHIHMAPDDAAAFGVTDGQRVRVAMETVRPVVFNDVLIRVRQDFALAMHIDFDEANACAFQNGAVARICGAASVPTQAIAGKEPDLKTEPAAEIKPAVAVQIDYCGLLTADTAAELARTCGGTLHLAAGNLITPLARDVLRDKKIKIVWEEAGVC